MKKNILCLTILTLIFLIFKNYNLVLSSTIFAVKIWLYKVFPYLFIMITLNDVLINVNFSKFFKNTSTYIFIMSLLSGTPSSAYITSNLYKQGTITKNYANTCLIFTYFSNPLFLYTILNSIFQQNSIIIKLIIIHYLSNITLYIKNNKKLVKSPISSSSFTLNLSSSIKSAINTTMMVLGSITFYLVISNIIITEFNLGPNLSLILRGILEMTQGLNYLITANINFKELITIFFISFGGLSIHTQVKCILDDSNLNYKYYLKGRIYQTIIALFLTAITQTI